MLHGLKFFTWLLVISMLVLPTGAAAQSQPASRPTTQDPKDATSGGQDWFTYGGALNNQRYSSLSQINTSNVQDLQGVWMTRLGSGDGSIHRSMT